MPANPRLAFGIPTYRRPEQLARCVRSIMAAAAPHRVAIHITDDACDDTNLATVESLRRQYPLIVHHRNPRTLGIDRNILQAADVCETEYAWLMGEDDRVLPHAVERVLTVLHSRRPAFLFVNYASIDEHIRIVLRERALDLADDTEMSAEAFFAEHGWASGFIGGCVVRKDRWQMARREPYLDTFFAHVGMIFESVAGASVYAIADAPVWNRCGTARIFTWTGQAFEVLSGWTRMARALEPLYPAPVCEAAVRAFRRAHGLDTLKFLAYLRADGAYDLRAWRDLIGPRGGSVAYRFGARLIAQAPVALLSLSRNAVNRWRFRRCRRVEDPGDMPASASPPFDGDSPDKPRRLE